MASSSCRSLSIDLIDELWHWLDIWQKPARNVTESKYWRVETIPNKGLGMVATQHIPAYTVLVIETALLYETKQHLLSDSDKDKPSAQLLLRQFNEELPQCEQHIVLNLANVFKDDEKANKILAIYDTSACQTNTSLLHSSGIFPMFSRVNHSCLPNAFMQFKPFPTNALVVKTLFEIAPNAEITIAYLPKLLNTYEERQNLLWQRYRFKCRCELCKCGKSVDSAIKEYRMAVMNGAAHWNCIQTALNILDTHFKAFPTVKANLLATAIECATEHYLYDEAYALITQSIDVHIKLYGAHCERWKEIYDQIQLLYRYSNDERCQQLIQKFKCLWRF